MAELVVHKRHGWPRRIFGWIVRVGVSAGLLVIVANQIEFDRDELLPDWNTGTPVWLAAAFVLTLTAFVLSAVRWQRVLRALGDDENLGRLFSHYMAGQFVSNFLPSSVGGDVLRVSRLSRDTNDAPVSFTSVVFERLSGWLVLPLITYAGFAVNPGLLELGTSTRIPLFVATATLIGLLLVIVVVGSDWIGDSLHGRAGLLRFANAVHLGIDRFREHPAHLGDVVASAFAYQVTLLCAALCAAQAMQLDPIGPTALMAFLPAVLMVQVIPLGIGGFGLREGAMVVFMSAIDVPDARAAAFGLLLGLLTLSGSIIGFPALLLGGRHRRRTPHRDAPTGTVDPTHSSENV